VVAEDIPHHVTQRGNGRQYILDDDPSRQVYLDPKMISGDSLKSANYFQGNQPTL
jgi:hypothetical protein